jgi:hypothetical protein
MSEPHGPMPESVALQCLYGQRDMRKLRSLDVGEKMVDADGDEWERTA